MGGECERGQTDGRRSVFIEAMRLGNMEGSGKLVGEMASPQELEACRRKGRAVSNRTRRCSPGEEACTARNCRSGSGLGGSVETRREKRRGRRRQVVSSNLSRQRAWVVPCAFCGPPGTGAKAGCNCQKSRRRRQGPGQLFWRREEEAARTRFASCSSAGPGSFKRSQE